MRHKALFILIILAAVILSGCTQKQKDMNAAKDLAESCYKTFLDSSAVKDDSAYFSIKAKSGVLNVNEYRVIVKAEYPTEKEPKCAQVVIKSGNCTDIQDADC